MWFWRMALPLLGYLMGYYFHLIVPWQVNWAWKAGVIAVFLGGMVYASKRHTSLIFIAFAVLGSLRSSVEKKPLLSAPKALKAGTFVMKPLASPQPTSYGCRMITQVWFNGDSSLTLMLSVQGLPPDSIGFYSRWTASKLPIQPLHLHTQPYQFSYHQWLASQGIQATASLKAEDIITWNVPHLSLVDRWKEWRRQWSLSLRNKLSNHPYALQLLPALLLGDRAFVSKEVKQSFADAGVVHVLAVSGMHLGLIYAVWNWLLGLLTIRSAFKKLLLLVGIWGFAGMAGMPISVIRAALMLSVSILAGKRLGFYPLLITVFFMLYAFPSWLMEVGFQLSVLAVWGILLSQQRVNQAPKLRQYVVSALRVSSAAQWATLPVIIGVFGRFPIYFLVANLLLLPLITILLYAAMAWLTVNVFTPWGVFLLDGLEILAQIIVEMSHWIASLDHAVWEVGLIPLETLGLWMTAWLLISMAVWGRRRWRGLALMASLPFCLLGKAYQQNTTLFFWHSTEGENWISLVNDQGWQVFSPPHAHNSREFYDRLPQGHKGSWHKAQLHTSAAGLILLDPEEKFRAVRQQVEWYSGGIGGASYLLSPLGDSVVAPNGVAQWKLSLLEAEK